MVENINTPDTTGRPTAFVEFTFSVIEASLVVVIKTSNAMSDGKMDKAALRWLHIEKLLKTTSLL